MGNPPVICNYCRYFHANSVYQHGCAVKTYPWRTINIRRSAWWYCYHHRCVNTYVRVHFFLRYFVVYAFCCSFAAQTHDHFVNPGVVLSLSSGTVVSDGEEPDANAEKTPLLQETVLEKTLSLDMHRE